MTDIDEASPGETALSPGQLLLQARERAQLTHEQVAQALHMTVSKVRAIESDDYDKMNADTFVRGYLRSYAGLLRIDPGTLITAYEQQAIAKGLLPSIERVPVKEQSGRKGWGFIAALLGFLVLLLLISVWFFDNRIAPAPSAMPAQTLPSVSGVEIPVEKPVENNLAVVEESISAQALSDEVVSDAAANATQSDSVAVAAPEPATRLESVVSGQSAVLDRLDLAFSDECWLEVSDAQGDVLATDLQRPGSRLTLMGRAPFQVKLGFASAASLMLNGEPVDIAPQAGAKVLTLSVGE